MPRSQYHFQQLAVQVAFNTPQADGRIGIPILLWGAPGQGKSSFLESFRREGYPVETIIAAIHDPTDFSGLPMLIDGKVVYAAPQWTDAFEQAKEGLLFLDELSTAPPAVQAALLRVVLERKVGAMQLPKGVRIVAAANPPDSLIGGWELSPPLANRFVHLDWSLPAEAYALGITKGFDTFRCPPIRPDVHIAMRSQWEGIIAAFLRDKSEYLNTTAEEGNYAFASPRTWSFAAMLLTSIDVIEEQLVLTKRQVRQIRLLLLKGCIGNAATIGLLEYVDDIHLPSASSLLRGDSNLPLYLRDDELFALWGQFNGILSNDNPPDTFLVFAEHYLGLIEMVLKAERLDVIYVSFHNLLKTGFLQKVLKLAKAESASRYSRLRNAMEELFAYPALVDLADILYDQNL